MSAGDKRRMGCKLLSMLLIVRSLQDDAGIFFVSTFKSDAIINVYLF